MLVWRFINGPALLVVLLWAGFVPAPLAADRATTPSADSVVITSQSLVFKNQENMAVFAGKVVMVKAGFIMHADHMVAYFAGTSATDSPTPKKPTKSATATARAGPELPTLGSRAVSLIEATGNVIMEQGNKKAKSKKAVYSQHDEKLVLTGEPEAWEQGYHVTGTKMTMFLKEDRSIVETSRVVISDLTGAQ
jgi:lipopolysaccharide export system protein LptA